VAFYAAGASPHDPAGSKPVRCRTAALRTGGLAAAAASVLLVLTGCLAPGGGARVENAQASGDGTLRIGLILDNTGKQDFLNPSQLAAAKLAVREINAAGGHKGKPVELLPESVGTDTAGQARDLTAAKADVVIGPTDSSRAPAAIDALSNAKIALISPANAASGLSTYASGGYYFRTAAADVAQAAVLVKLARDGGAKNLAVVHEEDGYGQNVATAVGAAAKDAGLGLVTSAEFKPGQAQQAAAAVKAAAPDAVVLIARAGAQGAIAELNNAGMGGRKLVLSDGAVNNYGSGLGSGALEGARGVLPGVFPSAHFQAGLVSVDPALKDMTFAAETYDAVNLAAIAAAAAEDDAGTSVVSRLISVSGGKSQPAGGAEPAGETTLCTSYQACVDVLRAGKRPDYDGQSGGINFDSNGDVTSANYMVFNFGANNQPIRAGSETASSGAG
jgi:neutral amino acid transport system substrate-binding protein